MESFEELGVAPELVEALAAEGMEVPTAFQASAIPVLLRGNPLLAQAGPGAGTLLAYGIPLLQTLDPENPGLQALVLVPTLERAHGLAQSLARLASESGHRVAALGGPWALPELATILFGTPEDLVRSLKGSETSVEGVKAVVVDSFSTMAPEHRNALESLFQVLPGEGNRVLLSLPFGEDAEAFGKAHLHRAVHLPPKAADAGAEEKIPSRGGVSYRIAGEEKDQTVLQTVSGILEGGAHHALLFTLTDDQAADLGDFLALHGYLAGPPGDESIPVWLSALELEGRKTLDAWESPGSVVTVSVDVPTSPDSLDRRHGGQEDGIVLVRPREMAHLRDVARRTGYKLVPAKEPPPSRVTSELHRLTELLTRTLRDTDLAPHFLALEPLFQDYAPGEVAAAALALLQDKQSQGKGSAPEGAPAQDASRGSGPAPKTWVRLFVGVGEKEGIGPGDLLGAIAGEAGVEGSQVGKIEIRETFSLVEVVSQAADRVIRGLNGTSIKGRSVRADYDRGGPKGRSPRKPRGGPPRKS
jgi:ATP-dependent RNA helicase DeaD